MNEVCSFLDHCSAYIQALNSFCSSSSVLAKSLVRVFHNVPVYREVGALILGAWEDLGRATAAASAAVKTETLMTLQDVLNRLEGEGPGDESAALTESIQAVGSCLGSYLELQVQFSYSAWKALSKVSKSLPQDRNASKSAAAKSSAELATTIKKHFASLLHKLGASAKQGNPGSGGFTDNSQQSQFYVDYMEQASPPTSAAATASEARAPIPQAVTVSSSETLTWSCPSEQQPPGSAPPASDTTPASVPTGTTAMQGGEKASCKLFRAVPLARLVLFPLLVCKFQHDWCCCYAYGA